VHETRVIGTRTYVTEYAWDEDGLLVGKTYPSGRIVTYARNASGEVTAVTTRATAVAPAVTIADGIGYEPFGPVNALSFGNGVTLALAYDLDGRLSAMDAFDGATPVLDLDYGHDLAGNITGITDAGGGHRGRDYAYDELHRLTQTTPTTNCTA
jgi:YD repeat-containing protein